jgi:hypothetical protein
MQALGLVWENLVRSGRPLQAFRTPIAEPTHFGARLLLEHWWDRQPRGGIVMGRDLPLRSLGCILRNLAIYEPLDGGRDYHVRLAGAAFMRLFAQEISGLNISQFIASDCIDEHREELSDACEGAPISHSVRIMCGEKIHAEFETLHLRILAPKGVAAWVLGSVFFADWA